MNCPTRPEGKLCLFKLIVFALVEFLSIRKCAHGKDNLRTVRVGCESNYLRLKYVIIGVHGFQDRIGVVPRATLLECFSWRVQVIMHVKGTEHRFTDANNRVLCVGPRRLLGITNHAVHFFRVRKLEISFALGRPLFLIPLDQMVDVFVMACCAAPLLGTEVTISSCQTVLVLTGIALGTMAVCRVPGGNGLVEWTS